MCVATGSLLLLLVVSNAAAHESADPEPFTDCRLAALDRQKTLAAKCTWLSVPENPDQPEARHIKLKIAVIEALNKRHGDNPLVVIAGGPGQSALEFYTLYAQAFSAIARDRDILLIDQRGTGKSNPLKCPVLNNLPDVTSGDQAYQTVTTEAEKCLADLETDTRYYTTSVAVRDIETVRRQLGYKKLNIYGVSYGTRVAMHYMRRFPASVRTVVLDGVLPPGVVLGPDIAVYSQRALDGAIDRCMNDEFCRLAFPDFGLELEQLLETIRTQTITVKAIDPATHQFADKKLSEEDVIGLLRLLLYSPELVSILPQLVHQANTGKVYAPLKRLAMQNISQLAELISTGMHNSVVCTEDMPFVSESEINKAGLADTYLGDRLLKYLQAVCKVWPQGVLDPDFRSELKSSIPVLMFSGSEDPITPPEYAERVMRDLKNALHLVGQNQGHGLLAHKCFAGIMREFIDKAATGDLNTECVNTLQAEPFFISPFGPIP